MSVYFGTNNGDGVTWHSDVQPFTYPGGEHHLKNLPDDTNPSTVWIADVRGADDADLTYAHMYANVAHQRQAPFVLLLPYLPAARSDRAMVGEPIGAAVYAERVNAMNPQQVICIDTHSTVAQRYVHKMTELDPYPMLRAAIGNVHYDAVIAPDKGAFNRANHVASMLGIDCYQAEKHRDEATGKITGITIENLPKTGKYLVPDDICDGGGTFMGLAEASGLHRDQIDLWITHAIFSGRAIDLRQYYGHIYTTDSHPGHNGFGTVFSAEKHGTLRVHICDSIVPCGPSMLASIDYDKFKAWHVTEEGDDIE